MLEKQPPKPAKAILEALLVLRWEIWSFHDKFPGKRREVVELLETSKAPARGLCLLRRSEVGLSVYRHVENPNSEEKVKRIAREIRREWLLTVREERTEQAKKRFTRSQKKK